MIRRPAKVRITNYQATTGLDHLSARQEREKAEHDKAVANYPRHLLVAVAEDLWSRKLWNQDNPSDRWVMQRRAACSRRIQGMV